MYKRQPQGGSFSGVGKVVANIWGIFMGSVNTLVLAVLIYVAFMNILRVQMDSYAIKKFLPTFIMAVILANFSFLICRVVIDLGNIAMSIFLVGAQPGTSANPGGNTSAAVNGVSNAFDSLLKVSPCGPGVACANVDTANYWGYIFFYIIKQAIIAVGAVFVFILGFLFIVRNYYIYFLVAVSPVYFLSMALPMTKKYFSQWMGQFTKWVFMPIISVFWIWLAGQFVAQIPDTGGGILIAFFAILCFYMAFTSPFKVDKTIGTWGGMGKKVWGKTGGAAWNSTGGAGINAAKGWVNDKYSNVKRTTVNAAKDHLPIVKQWSRSAAKGRLRQAVVNSAFEDKDKKRDQQALVDFINTKEFKRRGGFEDPTFKKLKGQVKKLLTDDERDVETYKQHSTSFLVGNVALNKGVATDKDGNIDHDKTITMQNGEQFHHASVEYMAQNNGKKGVVFYDGYGRKMKAKDTRTLIAEDTAAATQIKLNANNSAANSRSAETDYVGPEHLVAEASDKHRNRLKLGPVDPRTMTSTGVPDAEETPEEAQESELTWQEQLRKAHDAAEAQSGSPTRATAATSAPTQPGQAQTVGFDPETVKHMNNLLDAFGRIEEQLGGQGSVAGENGSEKLLAEIGKIKPNLQLDDLNLGAMIMGKLNVNAKITDFDQEALRKFGMMSRRIAQTTSHAEEAASRRQYGVLTQIADFIKGNKNPKQVKSSAKAGKQALGIDTENDEGEE